MDKDATMEIMKYFGMKRPGLFIKHTIKRPSNTGRRK